MEKTKIKVKNKRQFIEDFDKRYNIINTNKIPYQSDCVKIINDQLNEVLFKEVPFLRTKRNIKTDEGLKNVFIELNQKFTSYIKLLNKREYMVKIENKEGLFYLQFSVDVFKTKVKISSESLYNLIW